MIDVIEQGGASREVSRLRGLVPQDGLSFRLYSEQTWGYWDILNRRGVI